MCPTVVYGAGCYTLTGSKVGTRYVAVAIRTLVDPADPKDVAAGPRAAGRDQGQPEEPRQLRGAELGSGQPEESARCAAGARHDHAGLQEGVRHQGRRSIRCGI